MKEKIFYLILHRVRSAYNVGSIFRTSDGIGIDKIFLTGFTPAPPKKRFELQTKSERMISKTALGAENNISWEKKRNISEVIFKLKNEGFHIVALEQDTKSIDYRNYNPPEGGKIALIVGNEPRGIDKRVLNKCDAILEIPMRGKKKSLNVAVALGIAGYELSRK